MFTKIAYVAAVAAAAGLGLVGPGSAGAAPVPMGGGSGIVIDDRTECTLATIGNDNAGRLVGFTAGHCGEGGAQVVSEQNPDAGTIGRFAYSNPDLDYAVIEFDRAKVTPVNRIGNTTIARIGSPAQFPNIVCKQGRTTGNTCGLAYGDVFGSNVETWSQMCVVEGDSGAPVVVGDTLVSMVNAYLAVACVGPEVGTNMSTIMEAANRGGVGAGFAPI
ncbi:peptidase S1 family protein [Skermania piniformis]|uniref:S1 family peptidase n=1 Tax=Skermania pinensis TaxID=39122 RepID=A0ABX8S7C6_9ACTN|nr:peptidase S1 family protein [Skermania piniformis]QXQ13735.1 S1 family peptidase [Skermania piniformis]